MVKRLIVLAGILAALALTGCASSASAVHTVDPPAFLETTGHDGVVVIDVRTPEEFAAGHLQNAVNINVEDPAFTTQIEALDEAATYAVYCRSGRRSAIATDAMAAAGFTSLINLNGGLDDLADSGASVVTQ
jgi:phage shock protein E